MKKREHGTHKTTTHALNDAFQTISVHPRVSAFHVITYYLSMENSSPK